MSDVSLTGAQRSSLFSLNRTNDVQNRTQENLATGRRVNDVNDNALAFFLAQQLNSTANDLVQRQSDIDQAISAVRTSTVATDAIEDFTQQLRGLAESARSASPQEQQAITNQFQEIGNQIRQIAQDASFNGVNLLNSNNSQLQVQFSEREDSTLTIQGNDLTPTDGATDNSLFAVDAFAADGSFDLAAFGVPGGTFVGIENDPNALQSIIRSLDQGVERVRARAQELGSNIAILETRASAVEDRANELQAGADALTLADLTEEAARSVAAETSQQLGIQSLAISGGQQRAIVGLINGSAA
ncbi:MAG: hypothetical protein RIM72_06855 [Alphaproteobacteria bacterium]